MKRLYLLPVLLVPLMFHPVLGQNFELNPNTSKIIILGTSTIHDWEVEANILEGNVEIENGKSQPFLIKSLELEIAVKGLESGKSAMDKKMFDALKYSGFPKITYHLTSIETKENVGNSSYSLLSTGKISIAGLSKEISMKVLATSKTGALSFKGETTIDMTSFLIEPPTAVFGSIKTGKDVTVKFNVNFQKPKNTKL